MPVCFLIPTLQLPVCVTVLHSPLHVELRRLYVHNNRLALLPESFGSLSRLEHLACLVSFQKELCVLLSGSCCVPEMAVLRLLCISALYVFLGVSCHGRIEVVAFAGEQIDRIAGILGQPVKIEAACLLRSLGLPC